LSNISIIRVPNHTWPFSEDNAARLELVYNLNTKLGGREPTTRAVFRGLAAGELYLLEINWLSLPRLVPGRIFSESPHVSEGKQSGEESATTILPNSVEILTLRDAQFKLKSSSLHNAFEQDKILPETKVFHWFDEEGFEYWLPVIEFIRKLFVRSPEMVRAIIMYDGWSELVEDYTLYESSIDIKFTKHPQIGDIQYLSLLAAKPNLLDAWCSVSTCLPRAGIGATIDLAWPFVERVTIHFTAKQRDGQVWIQELLDVKDMDIPYEYIIPHHPSYINRTYEGERVKGSPKETNDIAEDNPTADEAPPNLATASLVAQQRSSAKVYMHIQTGSLSAFEQIKVMPEYNDIPEKATRIDSDNLSNSQAKEVKDRDGAKVCLTDAISSKSEEGYGSIANAYTKEPDNNQLIESNLKGFVEAAKHTKKVLGEDATFNWVVKASPLKLPNKCGSRWFLKIDGNIDRLWCLLCITYQGSNYYLLEVGRTKEENKFFLSTLLFTKLEEEPACLEYLERMIRKNGSWDTRFFTEGSINNTRLHHLYKESVTWGEYIAKKIQLHA